mgnify:CR=1 FL=1
MKSFLKIEIWSKMEFDVQKIEILVKNHFFKQKLKFWLKIII